MKLSLQQQINFFTLCSCLLFVVLFINILWSVQVVEVALEREEYANKIVEHTNILKQFILSENIYDSNYNTIKWQELENRFNTSLKLAPNLSPQQQTIQNSIESQNKNVIRLFDAINKNKLKNADAIIKNHLKTRLITQLEAIRSDSIQLITTAQQDIRTIIRRQIISILSILGLSITCLIYGTFRLSKIFRTSLKEITVAFEKNHSGHFQTIHLSNQSEEFNSIANAFNTMNKKLSKTTVSLESMKIIVEEKIRVLEEISNTDPLTKVANRRALFDRGNEEFSRRQRTLGKMTVALLDCDLFKDINDDYGHLFGDEVLKHLSNICTQEIRKIDFFARYGGEEFIIILPECGLKGAIEIAKRIQQSLAKNSVTYEGINVCVTVSIGICSVSNKHNNFEQVIKEADTAMYQAKKNGRNRIEIIDEAGFQQGI
jgi:diguanylate cyclase (GGDEF)-like protein